MSLTGLVVVIGSLFSFFMLLILDAVAHFSNPYISILTWLVAPAFLVSGLLMTFIGMLRERHRRKGGDSLSPPCKLTFPAPRPSHPRRLCYRQPPVHHAFGHGQL